MEPLLVDELIDILNMEAKIYDGILNTAKGKTAVIVEGKVSELEKITKLEQSMVVHLAKLEDVREELVSNLSDQLMLDPSEVSISKLAELLQQEQARRLETGNNELSKVLSELKDINGLNSKLIENSLDYINFSINLLASVETAGNTYGNSGQVSGSRKRNFFDVKL